VGVVGMTAIRVGAIITGILGVIYAAAGLLSSLTDFGIGIAVVCAAIIIHGLATFIDERDSTRMQRFRDEVWTRRDGEESQ
jgi:hypothetical protein